MNAENASSPLIESLSWGKMEVEGLGEGKDFKLWPGGGREWDWAETGTSHSPGIQPEDVKELVENGAKIIVLTRGMLRRLRTKDETLDWLKQQKVQVERLETRLARDRYNELAEAGQPVGGLFHSTC